MQSQQGLSPSHGKLWGFDGSSELAQIEGQRLGPPLPALTRWACVLPPGSDLTLVSYVLWKEGSSWGGL